MRFYHINPPDQVFRIPRYMLRLMIEQLPALEALEAQQAATIALLPQAKDQHRRSFFRTLRGLVKRFEPRKLPLPRPTVHDPAAAAAWFAARGAKVK